MKTKLVCTFDSTGVPTDVLLAFLACVSISSIGPAEQPRKASPPKKAKGNWTPAAEAQLVKLREKGYTYEQLAKKFGTTRSAVGNKLTQLRKKRSDQ